MTVKTSLGNGHSNHDLGSQEAQTDCHDGLRIRQQREGLWVDLCLGPLTRAQILRDALIVGPVAGLLLFKASCRRSQVMSCWSPAGWSGRLDEGLAQLECSTMTSGAW